MRIQEMRYQITCISLLIQICVVCWCSPKIIVTLQRHGVDAVLVDKGMDNICIQTVVDDTFSSLAYPWYITNVKMVSKWFVLCCVLGFILMSSSAKEGGTGLRSTVRKLEKWTSIYAGIHLFPLPYMYTVKRLVLRAFISGIRQTLSDYALLLLGGSLTPSKTGEGITRGYFHFLAPKKSLRGELDKLLQRKIEEPGLDIYSEGKGVAAVAIELLQS